MDIKELLIKDFEIFTSGYSLVGTYKDMSPFERMSLLLNLEEIKRLPASKEEFEEKAYEFVINDLGIKQYIENKNLKIEKLHAYIGWLEDKMNIAKRKYGENWYEEI